MEKSTALVLTASGVAAAILYALARSKKGEEVTAEALEEVIVGVKRVATSVGEYVALAGDALGLRNKNPGNIEWIADPAKRWRGMIGRNGRFGVFDTYANGVRAIGGELRASIKKGHTIAQAIHEWAPPSENNTDAYVRAFADGVGAVPAVKLTGDMVPAGVAVIIRHENGKNPFSLADIAAWVNS
jgi:hypothetical protein